MSLFDLTPQDFQDCEDWAQHITTKNAEFVQTKSNFYSFDFDSGKPIPRGNFNWERTDEVTKRLSTIRMSSVSTFHTLGDEDNELAEIPSINDIDIRLSRESVSSSYALLPDRR